MSVLDIQHLLARLYTDEALLTEFLADRNGFCRKHAGGDADFFRQIDHEQLEFFARSLRWKRAREVEKLLPLTAAALGRGFSEEFLRYSATCIPTGARPHAADAMAFCAYLLASGRPLEKLAREAARYERLRFRLHYKLVCRPGRPTICQTRLDRRPWFRLAQFAYELPGRAAGAAQEPWAERATVTVFVRLPGLCGIWYW